GAAPWNGSQLAGLVQGIDGAGARRIHLDSDLANTGSAQDSQRLETAFSALRASLSLPARFSIDPVSGARSDYVPPERFTRHASLVNTNFFVSWDGAVWLHPQGATVAGRLLPSLSSLLGDRDHPTEGLFPIDYGIDIRSIPIVSASDVLLHRVPLQQLAGKDVVIARTDDAVERFKAPGYALVPAVIFHLIGAETVLAGPPVDLGWVLPSALGLLIAGLLLHTRRRSFAASMLGLASASAIIGPLVLEGQHIHAEVVPAIAIILTAASIRAAAHVRRAFRDRGTTNLVTGMPNLQALRQSRAHDGAIVAARVKNYAQIMATLSALHEKELVDQIVGRLEFGAGKAIVYQADEGVFVWLADSLDDGIIQQLEGLQGLFRSPIVVATRLIDLVVTFGLDLDASRPVTQRVSSALVAADEAARGGKGWASFNPSSAEEADWEMSLLARLDQAIDNGELWVAYQPKVDCRTNKVIGAEALVRWTHPEKGQVYPDQFIAAAEQGGRIERLTYFVLDEAIAAAAEINRGHERFTVAVNLSVLLLNSATLVPTVKALLRKHGVTPALLTLEVTETSTMGSVADQLTNLHQLAEMGVELSIDDYGTGFSTLEYLRRIPASEIKIDRSFVSMLNSSQSDRIMVNSTIQLAHSLGRKVVAEGVENEEILDALKRMKCDIVQGYLFGRPVPLPELVERISVGKTDQAA
ncbi:MAG: putative bifunctional diguanylate cyclase/phosphodiesterase, partial [Allosphingosinicella sp.]